MGGSRYERDLVNALTELGRPAIRAPTSGSATGRELPDLVAGSRVSVDGVTGPLATYSETWAIELKTTSETTAYADEAEVEGLSLFAHSFGATPFIGAKFKREGGTRSPFWLVRPQDCRTTDGGRFGVPESDVHDRAAYAVYPSTENNAAEIQEAD